MSVNPNASGLTTAMPWGVFHRCDGEAWSRGGFNEEQVNGIFMKAGLD